VPVLSRLQHLTRVTSWIQSHARLSEHVSMTVHCVSLSPFWSVPWFVHLTRASGAQVDSDGIQWLASRKSAGRHMWYKAVNDLIKGHWCRQNVPALLEPTSLCQDDRKLPDGPTVLPWANGRCLACDFTCHDTLAASHLNRAVLSPNAVAIHAESRKSSKYVSLSAQLCFVPIAVETLGAPGDEALVIFGIWDSASHRISSHRGYSSWSAFVPIFLCSVLAYYSGAAVKYSVHCRCGSSVGWLGWLFICKTLSTEWNIIVQRKVKHWSSYWN